MRTLINYIRQCFCNHEFIYEEEYCNSSNWSRTATYNGIKVSRTCKKCGFHKSYWKFLK